MTDSSSKKAPEPWRECQDDGHTFNVIDARTHDDPLAAPAAVTCTTCEAHWDIAPTRTAQVVIDLKDPYDPDLIRALRARIRVGDPTFIRALQRAEHR